MIIGSGYRPCACRDCMEIAIGDEGARCHECVDAGCDPERECQAATAYGGEPEDSERSDFEAPARLECITAGEHMVDRDGTGFCNACGFFDPPLPAGPGLRQDCAEITAAAAAVERARITPIHAACAANGFCIVSEGTAEPVRVIAAMIRALKTLDTEGRMDSTLRGPEAAIPEEALGDERHAFWSSAEARLVLDALTIALNALAPEGFTFTAEGEATRLGFFR